MWRSGRASDSKLRGPVFDPQWGHYVVSFCKAHLLPRVMVKTQEAVVLS